MMIIKVIRDEENKKRAQLEVLESRKNSHFWQEVLEVPVAKD